MSKVSIKTHLLSTALLLSLSPHLSAAVFSFPDGDTALLGDPNRKTIVKAKNTETLLEIARQHDLGQNQIVWANKQVDRWLPSKPVEKTILDKEGNKIQQLGKGKDIHIPNSYLLPNVKRTGIILNLPEYRLYYYSNGKVITHPISIGRVDWNTPLGITSIVKKVRNPTWTPPASIRREHAEQGEILPAVFPAGPDNPLGLFAMRLGRAGYLIHSTNKPLGVGMRVSHGCIRMYPEDIERIFPSVKTGTAVHIINEPIKVGWGKRGLYVSVHPDLEDSQRSYPQKLAIAMSLIDKIKGDGLVQINGKLLRKALLENNGIPVIIYRGEKVIYSPVIVEPITPVFINQPKTVPVKAVVKPTPILIKKVVPKKPAVKAVVKKRVVKPAPIPIKKVTPKKPAVKAVVKNPVPIPVKRRRVVKKPVVKSVPVQVKKQPVKKEVKQIKRSVQAQPMKQMIRSAPPRLNIAPSSGGYNNVGRYSPETAKPEIMTPNRLPPPPVIRDQIKPAVRLNPTPSPKKPKAALPRVKTQPKPPLPRLKKPKVKKYSILESAVPPQ